MIAMLLLLIGVAGVLSLQMVSVRATSFSRHATEATIVAEDKMEELLSMDGSLLVIMALTIPPDFDIVDSQAVAGVDYTRTWTINDGILDNSVLSVSVEVEWMERGTEPHSISIETQRQK
jgi:Tfp pilus assembly protein PilV